MSYRYEDTDYCYSTPVHYGDTSHYYRNVSAQLVDTSQYCFIVPEAVEHARELETYAEVAANRIYTWDEVHPAYRDHLTESYDEPVQTSFDDDDYYEDVTDEELAEMNLRCENYQKQMMEQKVQVGESDRETGTVEVEKGEYQERSDDEDNHPQLPQLPAQPLPTLPCHTFFNNVVATPSPDLDTTQTVLWHPLTTVPDILIPNPLPLAPNIWYMFNHLHPHPPDIAAPRPLPLKPNIPINSMPLSAPTPIDASPNCCLL